MTTQGRREGNNSSSPPARRSRGRIEPLRSRSGVQNHGLRFEGISNFNLQDNQRPSPNSRQIQSQRSPQFPLPINRFRIFHRRLATVAKKNFLHGVYQLSSVQYWTGSKEIQPIRGSSDNGFIFIARNARWSDSAPRLRLTF